MSGEISKPYEDEKRRRIRLNALTILINAILTVANQLIYRYRPDIDAEMFLAMAKEYCHFNFYDPILNSYGHPFYPFFLIVIGGISTYNFVVIAIIQSLIFSFSTILLVRELEKYLNKQLWGVLLLLSVVPELLFFNGALLTESVGFSLVILSFWVGVKILNKGATASNLLLLSFVFGLSVMDRFELVGCSLPLLYLIFPKIKGKLGVAILILPLFCMGFLLLNGIKNYKIFHKFKLTAYNSGDVTYGGNNTNLDGSPHNFEVHKEVFLPKNKIADFDKLQSLPPEISYPKVDSFFRQLAIEAWKEDPKAQLTVIPEKFAKNWLLPGDFDIYTDDTTKVRGLQIAKMLNKKYFRNNPIAPYKHLFYMIIHWILLLIIVIGIWNIDTKNRFQMAVLSLLVIYVFYTIPMSGLPRYHITVFPILIIAFTPIGLVNRINRVFYKEKSGAELL